MPQVWEDPFRKPCYLFALVAGDLAMKASAPCCTFWSRLPAQRVGRRRLCWWPSALIPCGDVAWTWHPSAWHPAGSLLSAPEPARSPAATFAGGQLRDQLRPHGGAAHLHACPRHRPGRLCHAVAQALHEVRKWQTFVGGLRLGQHRVLSGGIWCGRARFKWKGCPGERSGGNMALAGLSACCLPLHRLTLLSSFLSLRQVGRGGVWAGVRPGPVQHRGGGRLQHGCGTSCGAGAV